MARWLVEVRGQLERNGSTPGRQVTGTADVRADTIHEAMDAAQDDAKFRAVADQLGPEDRGRITSMTLSVVRLER